MLYYAFELVKMGNRGDEWHVELAHGRNEPCGCDVVILNDPIMLQVPFLQTFSCCQFKGPLLLILVPRRAIDDCVESDVWTESPFLRYIDQV